MDKVICSAVLAVAGLCAAPLANAAEAGFYVGGFYGTADKDEDQSGLAGIADSIYSAVAYVPTSFNSTAFDNESKGYGFFAGYRLFQYLAAEAGYMALGTVDFRERSSGSVIALTQAGTDEIPTDTALNLDSQIGGFAVSALGILPLSYNAEVYGRAGVMFSSHELNIYYADAIGAIRDRFSESDVDLLAGVGASYTLAEVYALRAEYVRVFDAGDKQVGEADVDMITIGITVRF